MPGTTISTRPTARLAALAALVTAAALAVAVPTTAQAAPADDYLQSTPATSFRVGTFNVLGADHTAPGGKRRGWDPGVVRIDRVATLLAEQQIDVVGFQEFQPPQAARFQQLAGTSWQTYPGLNSPDGPSVNSIGWRTDTWQLLEARTLPVPYFSGVPSNMPAVLLSNVNTGRQVWFFNTHNPADTRGPAQQWRSAGFAMEAALANELRATHPDAAFVSLGDKNERDAYYCAVAAAGDLWAANGGYADAATCQAPGGGAIDWILGSKSVFFNGYTRFWNDYVASTSDHPLYYANAVIPASSSPTIDNVVVVAVPGLTSSVAAGLRSDVAELGRLDENGASTSNARTALESTGADANLMSLLTGRRVAQGAGGHGIGSQRTLPKTVRAAAGEYVSGIFDLAHNTSHRTVFAASRPETRLVKRSWNGRAGGSDPYGVDDGAAKIDAFSVLRDDAAVVDWWKGKTQGRPGGLSVIELSDLWRTGLDSGFRGAEYQKAVRKTFRRVAAIRRSAESQPETAGRTLLVVTGTAGAQRKRGPSRGWAQSYRVPMWVSGPGVPAGSDLYDLNPAFASPGRERVNYSGDQPLRVGSLANLITRTLGVAPVPGSTIDPEQHLQVLQATPTILP